MGVKDFFRKVRILLEGDPEDQEEIYSSESKRESESSRRAEYRSDSASGLAERMADGYDEPEYEDDGLYDEPDYDDGYQSDFEYIEEDEEEEVIPEPVYTSPQRETIDLSPAAVDMPEQPAPLPSRTEVTLRQIERLSKKLDEPTLREYQTRLVEYKKQNGAISALTALRILHEYVPEDEGGSAQ